MIIRSWGAPLLSIMLLLLAAASLSSISSAQGISPSQLQQPIAGSFYTGTVLYPNTQAGVQSAINAAITAGGGTVVVPPGTTISITGCTTDGESTYGILIGKATNLKLVGLGATIAPTVSMAGCEVIAIRDSEQVTVEGFQITEAASGFPYTGTGISIRRPSNGNPGYAGQQNFVFHNLLTDLNIGIEVGGATEGQVSENTIQDNFIADPAAFGIQQLGANTATNVFIHDTVATTTRNNAVLWDMGGASATLIAPVAGDGTTTGTITLQTEATLGNMVIIEPNFETKQSGGADANARSINWLSAGLQLDVFNGVIEDFRSGTSVMFQMNNGGAGGEPFFHNVSVLRSAGTGTVSVSGMTLCADGGQWFNTSIYPVGNCIRSNVGGGVNGFTSLATAPRTWSLPDASGTVAIVTTVSKKGSGTGDYAAANTSYAAVDTTNLCTTLTVPTGWKLIVTASGSLGTATLAVAAQVALSDVGATCTTGGTTPLIEKRYIPSAVGVGFDGGWSLQTVIAGDGNAHSIALLALTSNGADNWSIQNSTATLTPAIVYQLLPSN